VSECDREALIMRPWPSRGSRTIKKVHTSVRGFQAFEGLPELMTKKISFNKTHRHYVYILFIMKSGLLHTTCLIDFRFIHEEAFPFLMTSS